MPSFIRGGPITDLYFVLSICTVSRTCMCLFFQPHHRLDVDFLLSVCLAHLRMFLPHHRHDVGFRLCVSCAACLYACSSTICHLPLLACLGHQHGSDISFSRLCCARLVSMLCKLKCRKFINTLIQHKPWVLCVIYGSCLKAYCL